MQITVRIPVVEVDGTVVILTIGGIPEAEFGDEVVVYALSDGKILDGMYVASVDSAEIRNIDPEVLALFGFSEASGLVEGLQRLYGTGFNTQNKVTIYTLLDGPVELS